MEQHTISNHQIASFAGKLQEDERSPATIENYLRHIRAFAAWAGEQAVTKELVASWKEHLTGKDYRPGTVNTMLVSLNRFLGFLGWHDCVVKTLRIQRRLFREDSKELTREEYQRLLDAAHGLGRERLALLMETSNPSQGRLRGKTDENLVVTGQDKYYLKAAGYGRLYDFGYDADGAPISERVARHVTGVAQFAVAFNELGLGNLVINGIPSYVDMAADIGQFLAPD